MNQSRLTSLIPGTAALLLALTAGMAVASEKGKPADIKASGIHAEASAIAKRGKVIDFDDEVVEGLNKKPLDSLSQISERDRRRKSHLYRKRSGFGTETRETLETLRYSQ